MIDFNKMVPLFLVRKAFAFLFYLLFKLNKQKLILTSGKLKGGARFSLGKMFGVFNKRGRRLKLRFSHIFILTFFLTIVFCEIDYANVDEFLIEYQNSPLFTWIEKPAPSSKTGYWYLQNKNLHPAVVNMPPEVEVSIESVAKYIATQESDPYLRIKALHDYVADRVAYDAESYFAGKYPPQDAETVFQTHKGVCYGYARLFMALGQAIGEDIAVIVGKSRTQVSDWDGQSHAWNAVKIQGTWYLLDATWDSGYVDRSGFTKRYRTDYLLTPPQILAISHLPFNRDWQLLTNPLSQEDFLDQPMMQPRFFAEGLKLLKPTSSQIDVLGMATIEIDNPNHRSIAASFSRKGESDSSICQVEHSISTNIWCEFPDPGTYEVDLFTSAKYRGAYHYVGRFEFNYSLT